MTEPRVLQGRIIRSKVNIGLQARY